MTGRLDWAGLLRAGLQRLGLRPGEFWQLTPAELLLMLGDGAEVVPMVHRDMHDLMRRWPDPPARAAENEGTDNGGRGQDRIGGWADAAGGSA